MRDALIVSLLSLVPRNAGARWMGAFARTRVSAWCTRAFVWAYGVDMAEAEPGPYPTLDALFTRRLLPSARPIDRAPGALVSPVDGRCAFVGRSAAGRIPLGPGAGLDLPTLLGAPVDGERDVCVLYLSPRDYHRVHAPAAGRATGWWYQPGTLWPVFPAAVRRVENLFARNERAGVTLETDAGPLAVVLVGAFGVGRITLEGADLCTNTGGAAVRAPSAQVYARGGPLGVFHLGSTVVLVAPPGVWRWTVGAGEVVRLGRSIAAR